MCLCVFDLIYLKDKNRHTVFSRKLCEKKWLLQAYSDVQIRNVSVSPKTFWPVFHFKILFSCKTFLWCCFYGNIVMYFVCMCLRFKSIQTCAPRFVSGEDFWATSLGICRLQSVECLCNVMKGRLLFMQSCRCVCSCRLDLNTSGR